jgi:hypothetical protein
LHQSLPLHLLKLLVTRNKLWGSSHRLKSGPVRDLSAVIEWRILGGCQTGTKPTLILRRTLQILPILLHECNDVLWNTMSL